MTDVVPEGYITLPEAARRLAATLADRHLFLKKNQKLLAHEFGLVELPTPDASPVAELPTLEAASPVGDSGDPDAERLRENRRYLILAGGKRQLAVWKLYEAHLDDALVSFVRDPTSGGMLRITATDWRGAAFWRNTIMGGEVRASPGELIERYANRLVLIKTAALEAWLKKAREPTTAPAVAECRSWLIDAIRANLDSKPNPKSWYRGEANRLYGVSRDSFNEIWTKAINKTGATAWAKSGRPKNEKENQ